jgi:DNA-binding MarR family transcriptional regulator
MSIRKFTHDILKQRIFDILREKPDITRQELADQLGVRYQSLYSFLRRSGICVPRPYRNRLKAPQLNSRAFQVLGYLVNHPYYTLQHVADQFDVSREYVSQIEVKAKNAGIIK